MFVEIVDARALERHLLSREGVRLNGPPIHGTQQYLWQGPDRGHLYIHITPDVVSVDTHAHWGDVLNLYEFLVPLEPDLLIVDNQTAMLYDASSYRSFVAESYARKT